MKKKKKSWAHDMSWQMNMERILMISFSSIFSFLFFGIIKALDTNAKGAKNITVEEFAVNSNNHS